MTYVAPGQPIVRVCLDCRLPFQIDVDEQEWFRRLAATYPDRTVTLPWRCTECRRARRLHGRFVSPREW